LLSSGGPNSICRDDESHFRVAEIGPHCICESGSIGKPPNCVKWCKIDECQSHEFCDVATLECRQGCGWSGQCEPNQFCNKDHKCVPGCHANYQCESSKNEICDMKTATCKEGCEHDYSCSSDSYCDVTVNKCKKGCSGPPSCSQKEYCDKTTRSCTPGCDFNTQCGSSEYCSDHKCVDLCSPTKCGVNSICSAQYHQISCSCESGFIPEAYVGCRKRLANETDVEIKQFRYSHEYCSQFCAEKSICGVNEGIFFCLCHRDELSNPFIKCNAIDEVAYLRPFDDVRPWEVPIDANLLKTLLGG
jgi:hypothetical protein